MGNRVFNIRPKYLLLIVVLFILIPSAGWIVFGRVSLLDSPLHRLEELYSVSSYPMLNGARISQSFKAVYPGLYRIDVLFNKRNDGKGKVIIHLRQSCNAAADLETITIQISEIGDTGFYPFIFPPIADSINREFCIVIESQSLENQSQLEVYASAVDVYEGGEAKYESNLVEVERNKLSPTSIFSPTHFIWLPIVEKSRENVHTGFDMGFQLYYYGPVLDTVEVLVTRLSANKPYFFGEPWFYGVILGVYVIDLILLWVAVLKIKTGIKP